jgi:Na+/H+ antiporter NhaA
MDGTVLPLLPGSTSWARHLRRTASHWGHPAEGSSRRLGTDGGGSGCHRLDQFAGVRHLLRLRDFRFGSEPLHLEPSVGAWTADGRLAIFFFLVGLELKREFVTRDLRQFSKSIVPVSALRIVLLTLAVVDDLIGIGISIVGVFYASDIQPWPLLLALMPLTLFTLLARN